jgi:urea transport system permease protein
MDRAPDALLASATPPVRLPAPRPLLTRTGWTAFLVALILVCAVAPLLNLVVPPGSPFHLGDYAVALTARIMCYAIAALAMDLIWGYTGILSLGHGLFFALGGYVMGMYLMRQIGRDGNYKSDLPDFMVFLDWKTLPWHWISARSASTRIHFPQNSTVWASAGSRS